MGLFDGLKNKSETFTFAAVPTTLAELQALPEASLDSPYKTTALVLLALCNYEKNPEGTMEMLEWLNGPDDVTAYQKQFYRDRLNGKYYKTFSFFAGATADNHYTPTVPYQITVSSNPHSFPEPNWATMYVKSAGADEVRPVKLRQKPSTGQWFVNEVACLADIRMPKDADPWA